MLKDQGVRVALLTPQAMEGSGPPPDLDGGNKALKIFSAGIKDVAAKTGVPFVDQYNPYLAICVSAHAAKPHEFLYGNGGDRIHPSALGQTIQAWIILKALGASPLVSRAEISSETKTVIAAEACRIEKLTVADGVMSFDRSDDALPMPIPPEAGPALKLAPILEDLNRYELQITGLATGSYELNIDGEAVAELTAAELAKGWNLAVSAGPITRQGQELLKQIKEKDELFYSRWRKVQLFEVPEWAQKPADARTAELVRLDRKIAEVEDHIERLRQPHPHHFELRAAIADGPFKPTFESLKQYEVPEWFMDAKLGIFMHWGPASVGGTSGWFGGNVSAGFGFLLAQNGVQDNKYTKPFLLDRDAYSSWEGGRGPCPSKGVPASFLVHSRVHARNGTRGRIARATPLLINPGSIGNRRITTARTLS